VDSFDIFNALIDRLYQMLVSRRPVTSSFKARLVFFAGCLSAALFLLTTRAQATDLFISDHETAGGDLSRPVRLFESPISQETRLYLYYSPLPFIDQQVFVRIVNQSTQAETFQVRQGTGNASKDTSAVAAKATGCFWLSSWGNGRQISVQAHGSADLILPTHLLGTLVTYNAIIQLKPLGGFIPGKSKVVVIVAPAGTNVTDDGSSYQLLAEGTRQHPNGVFPAAFVQEAKYEMGPTALHPPAGTPPPDALKIPDTGGVFGVKFTFIFQVHNPLAEQRTVDVYFEPHGGSAQATFVTRSGQMLQTVLLCGADFDFKQCARTGVKNIRYRLPALSRTVLPGQTSQIVIDTLGEGDSSYPAYVEVGEGLDSQDAVLRLPHDGYLWNFNGSISQILAANSSKC
jgi:hypothetical protein